MRTKKLAVATFISFRASGILRRMGKRSALMLVSAVFVPALFGQLQPNNGSLGGTSSPTRGGMPSTNPNTGTNNPFPNDPGTGPRPIYVSGKVQLSDGTSPPEPVKMQRVCNGNPRLEGYTDRKGHFSFELGRSMELQDASSGGSTISGSGFPSARGNANSMGRGTVERQLMGCELRADLPGFTANSISLSNIHYMDNPDVGIIVLHRISNVEGLTISATSSLAPKDARKAFEKALDLITKNKPDEAQTNLQKAVMLYPRYAAAWFELGRLQEQGQHFEEAHKSYEQSLVADSKYIQPYERLSWLALKDSNWDRLNELTGKMLTLDPIDYPDIYYMNSIANYQLQHFDVAEKNIREAIRLDTAKKNARSQYILGLVLAQKGDFTASAESFHAFLKASPDASDSELVRKQLAQVEEAAKGQTQSKTEQADKTPVDQNAPDAVQTDAAQTDATRTGKPQSNN